MTTSTLTLFYADNTKSWKLNPSNNFIIDNLEAYLAEYPNKYVVNDFQYLKIQQKLEIVVPYGQVYQMKPTFFYVKVLNSNNANPYYYFITKCEWRSESAVKLFLELDVVNTYKYGTDFILSNKTKINRQHKNRLVKRANYAGKYAITVNNYAHLSSNYFDSEVNNLVDIYLNLLIERLHLLFHSYQYNELDDSFTFIFVCDDNTFLESDIGKQFSLIGENIQTGIVGAITNINRMINYKYYRNIDLLSENINPILYKKSDSSVFDNSLELSDRSGSWYLIYKNENEPTTYEEHANPVNVFIVHDRNIKVALSDNQGFFNASSMDYGVFYYFFNSGFNGKITIDSNEYNIDNTHLLFARRTAMNTFEYSYIGITPQPLTIDTIAIPYTKNTNIGTSMSFSNYTGQIKAYRTRKLYTNYHDVRNDTTDTREEVITDTYTSLKSISDIDRTDSKLLKIIKLPYCPLNIPFDNDNEYYILPETLKIEDNMIQLRTDLYPSLLFEKSISASNDVNYQNIYLSSIPNHANSRNDSFESKIFNSEFSYSKFVYDSFSFAFQMEFLDLNYYIENENGIHYQFDFTFYPTSTINSRFLIKFDDYVVNSFAGDYSNILTIARNNEIVLYNSAYLNYIRNGFNYDVKNKNRQITTGGIMTGLGIAGGLISAIGGMATGGVGFVIAGGFAVSTLKSLTSAISNANQAEQNIQEKLQTYRNQSVAVEGSDDVDLMTRYTNGNKAKIVNYECSDYMKSLIYDLFYYFGYSCNEFGVPNSTSRYYFNFVSCENVYSYIAGGISEESINKISELFKGGITFIHGNTYNDIVESLKQEKENAEINIAEV